MSMKKMNYFFVTFCFILIYNECTYHAFDDLISIISLVDEYVLRFLTKKSKFSALCACSGQIRSLKVVGSKCERKLLIG